MSNSDSRPDSLNVAKYSRCPICTIRHEGMCGTLLENELEHLNHIAKIKSYPAGEVILSEEAPLRYYANIISGMIKLTKTTIDGREQIVAMLFASDFFGRVYGETAHTTATAVTDIELCTFPKQPFEDMLHTYPDIEHRLFEDVLDELDAAQDWMLLLGRKTAIEKVATFLLMLEKRLKKARCPHQHHELYPATNRPNCLQLPMTRSDMADYLGLTTETVCRQMTYLKRDGAILLPDNHSYCVADTRRLEELAGS
jgi:CRP/FNR family transcriptional regulator